MIELHQLGVPCEIAFADVGKRPDHHVPAIVGYELGGIDFNLAPKNRFRKNVGGYDAVTTQRISSRRLIGDAIGAPRGAAAGFFEHIVPLGNEA